MTYTINGGVCVYPITRPMLYDEATVRSIFREVDELFTTRDFQQLAVDFTRVELAGTPAVSLLVRLKAKGDQLGYEFGLCGLQPSFREVLQIMNLDQFFPIYENVEEAVATMSARQASVA